MSWVLYEGDCFNVFPEIEDKSVDMILCDLPYGTTACKWDTPLPLDELWFEYKRVIKDNGAIVLTASQPFTSKLVSSNYEMFKYSWVWDKQSICNPQLSKYQPLKQHEDVLIFSKEPHLYYPQGLIKLENGKQFKSSKNTNTEKLGHLQRRDYFTEYTNFPRSIIKFKRPFNNVHPTQKPVKLFEYLIKTYTNENELVLDNCAGSGTTGVACQNLNRNCILIEKEADYCNIIRERMATVETLQVEARKQQTLMDYCTAK